ncbi:MAG TPA: hypothetical protein VH458_08240 [Vicinamibacterales bacterium]|jgi:hypothetical protein
MVSRLDRGSLGRLARASSVLLLAGSAACGGRAEPVTDPIPDVPLAQQRIIDRSELRYQWPFTVGSGTLACSGGAVVFRNAGTSYAVNEAARTRGFTSIESIRVTQTAGPPSNPLARLKQAERERVFKEAAECEKTNAAETAACKRQLRDRERLSEEDLSQIEAEGRERLWPPLTPKQISLDAVVEAGTKLCPR